MQSIFTLPSTRRLIELALEEDLCGGDYATEALVDQSHRSQARLIAREPLIVCGLPLIVEILAAARAPIKVVLEAQDGDLISENHVLAKLSGATKNLLTLERTILNFLQRMSGVATMTNSWVKAARGITILDTRKTAPGFRLLDKYATRIGGATNHRINLGSMAMIKNNHIDVAGGSIVSIAQRVRAAAPLALPIEIEVRDLAELRQAIKAQPAVIMLDNMDDALIEKALKLVAKSHCDCVVEVSGGITIDRLPGLKRLGVTHVSAGALTHSAPAADISLRLT